MDPSPGFADAPAMNFFARATRPIVWVAAALLVACVGTTELEPAEASEWSLDAGLPPSTADAASPDAAQVDAGQDADGGADGGEVSVIDAGAPDAGPVDAGAGGQPFVYVGSGDGKISVYRLNGTTGGVTLASSIDAGTNPSFLAFDSKRRFLYAVNEGNPGAVASFSINPSTGALTLLNRVSSQGAGPAHLSVDRTGKWVMVANYTGGTVAVLPVQADGSLGSATDVESPGVNPHLIAADPSNGAALVPCKGSNLVAQFLLDPAAGTLTANSVPQQPTALGAGPRHLAFHPIGKFAYLINELDSTMTAFLFDSATGRLSPIHTVSTLPAGLSGGNTGAEVEVHPNGKLLFGSNRGHDSIVTYALDETTGRMTVVGHTATGGATPRSFAVDPSGTFLIAANQGSGTLHGFRIDASTGGLTPLGELAKVNAPAFVGIVELGP